MNNSDNHSLDTLYRIYSGDVFRYANSILKDDENARDAVQEVFIKCAKSLPEFRGQCSLKSWLLIITRNHCYNEIALKGYKHDSLDSIDAEAGVNVSIETALTIQDALNRLTPAQREILYLKDYAGYSYKEIAEMMDISIDNVKIRLFRIRDFLRKYLKDEF